MLEAFQGVGDLEVGILGEAFDPALYPVEEDLWEEWQVNFGRYS